MTLAGSAAQIRVPVTEENALLAALWRRAWHSANPDIAAPEPHAHWLARVQSEFAAPCEVLAIESAGRLAGFMAFNRITAYVAQLFVDVDVQGKGLGRALLDQACRHMPAGWSLHVATSNWGARRFYERYGMQPGAVDRNPHTGRERIAYRWHASVP